MSPRSWKFQISFSWQSVHGCLMQTKQRCKSECMHTSVKAKKAKSKSFQPEKSGKHNSLSHFIEWPLLNPNCHINFIKLTNKCPRHETLLVLYSSHVRYFVRFFFFVFFFLLLVRWQLIFYSYNQITSHPHSFDILLNKFIP